MTAEPRVVVHAIYTVLGELDLLRASVASIYPYVSGITIATTYDRDWHRNSIQPDKLVQEVLDRTFDPQRKIDLLVTTETNEARNRNRAMDFAAQAHRRTVKQHSADRPPGQIDYFWIVDADEVYEASDVRALLTYIGGRRKRYYQVLGTAYFKTWNNRVPGDHYFTAFVRSDCRLGARRNPYPTLLSRGAARLGFANRSLRLQGVVRVPAGIGRFHHGSYVGPRSRVASKVSSFSHSDDVPQDWLERVWDEWTPARTDFHPLVPHAFAETEKVRTSDLPVEIRDFGWPDGYLDEDG